MYVRSMSVCAFPWKLFLGVSGGVFVRTHACIHVWLCAGTCVCVHVYICLMKCVHVDGRACISACLFHCGCGRGQAFLMCVCVCVCVHARVLLRRAARSCNKYRRARVQTRTHAPTHTRTHTHATRAHEGRVACGHGPRALRRTGRRHRHVGHRASLGRRSRVCKPGLIGDERRWPSFCCQGDFFLHQAVIRAQVCPFCVFCELKHGVCWFSPRT